MTYMGNTRRILMTIYGKWLDNIGKWWVNMFKYGYTHVYFLLLGDLKRSKRERERERGNRQ